MQVEMVPVDAVREYERNPRQISDEAVAAVARSIEAFGFRVPIIVDGDGVIIAGHTRLRAARKLGLEKVPVIRADDLTPEQVRAFRVADNQVATLTTWDYDLLPIELAELRDAGIDWSLLGFDSDELAKLLAGEAGVKPGLTDPDEVPEPPDEATTRPGDLWVLRSEGGIEHRLLCGDAGKAEDVDRLLAVGVRPPRAASGEGDAQLAASGDGCGILPIHLVNTDPPYNVKVEPRSSTAIAAGMSSYPDLSQKMHHQSFDVARGVTDPARARKKMRPKDRPLENDFISEEAFEQLLHAWFGQMARVLEPGRSFYIWGGYANLGNYPPALKAAGLYFSQGIVWDKQHPVLTRKDFMGAFEICFYGWREGAGHHFFGPNNATDLWHVKKVNPQSMVHLTEKPVELAVRAIQYSSRPGEHVFDPFGGSGSTLIACEQTGRRCFMLELDPLYCDVIVQRWEKFTGRKAERVRDEQDSQTEDTAPVAADAVKGKA